MAAVNQREICNTINRKVCQRVGAKRFSGVQQLIIYLLQETTENITKLIPQHPKPNSI